VKDGHTHVTGVELVIDARAFTMPVIDTQLLHRIISKASGEGLGTNADGKLKLVAPGDAPLWKLTFLDGGHFRSTTKTMGNGMSLDVDSESWKLVPVK